MEKTHRCLHRRGGEKEVCGNSDCSGFYGLFLSHLGGNLPYVDSISTVLSVVAQILCVKRYCEQWLLWIVVNAVSVIMWIFAFWNGGESVATLLMWSIYLVNAIMMYQKWSKETKMCDIK